MRKTSKAGVQQPATVQENKEIAIGDSEQAASVPVMAALPDQPELPPVANKAVTAIEKPLVGEAVSGWGPVDMGFMDPAMGTAPALPLNQLPHSFAALVTQFSKARCLVPDFVAFSLLSAVSGAIGNRIRVRLYDGTLEPLAIFAALVGEPSTGKGQAIKLVEGPLTDLDEEMSGFTDNTVQAAGNAALERVTSRIQARVAGRLAIDYETPIAHQDGQSGRSLLLTETTGAGLLDELSSDNAGRMLLAHELSGSLAFFGTGQSLRARSLLLNAFDGNAITIRTKGGGKVRIPALLLTILGATQPTRLPGMLRNADDGFAARFFWIYPSTSPSAELGVDQGPVDVLEELLSRVLHTLPLDPVANSPAAIPLASDARPVIEAASKHWVMQQQLSNDMFSGVLGRGRQYAIRLAGLLQIIDHMMSGQAGLPDTIGAGAIGSAVALVDTYILPMAERTLSAARPGQSDAVALAKFLARRGKAEINARDDIVRGDGSPLRETLRVREAIEELAQRGLLRPEQRSGGRGRPSGNWHVHPSLLALKKW